MNIFAKIDCDGYVDIYRLHRNQDDSLVWRFYTYAGIGSLSEIDAINLKVGADRIIKYHGFVLKFEPEDLLLKEG